jgi:hypothetical protein
MECEQHYGLRRTCLPEWRGRTHDDVVRQIAHTLLAEAKPGQPYTFRYEVRSEPDPAFDFHPLLVVRGDLYLRRVEVMEVKMARPQPVDEMEWRRLIRTATQEIAGRLKRKLRFWRRRGV